MGEGTTNSKVDICIPTYYASEETPRVLRALIHSINDQDYDNIVVCAAVQSVGDAEKNKAIMSVLAECTKECIAIGNNQHGPAGNTRAAINLGHGEYVKIMNHDDLLDRPDAISAMVNKLQSTSAQWLVNACQHTDAAGEVRNRLHVPFFPGVKALIEGQNRLGCPSVVMYERSLNIDFDPNLALCMDCDMWIQLFHQAGAPDILNTPHIVVRMWEQQLSNQLDYASSLETDKSYMRNKYGYA